ncbi:Bifunctional DNA primase/polymerase [Kribbella flavida DSM 17836]|uniref:Bifunctional DNA primase/polymerase n=1 Tax=Kribbella flavida (strain DSM 17836 / JCM 10339 / NBRC 14399) TaxID=479435 RepID=D2PKT9_KRIFD|nr:bifunctional DNA primase/polymerase [Kribbella flavida]ADB32406.1 Bifunctional DNA primase/polymerase [Kribbella flavida DSM 17836]
MTTPTPILTAALDAAGRGWPVFMLGRSKRPVANCETCRPVNGQPPHDPWSCGHLTCHGFYAATTDTARVAAIVNAVPGGQLAVRTGMVSGLLVVDVDPAHGGWESLSELVARQLVPRTLWVRTGSDGAHLYYRHPGLHMPSRPMPNRPGIDVKADGGYVVLPPSIHHRTRRPYAWGTGSDLADPAAVVEMPPPLIAACLPATPAESTHAPSAPLSGPQRDTGGGGISHPDKLLTAHLDAVRQAPQGKRRTTLYGAARGVARMVAAGALDPAAAVAALTYAGHQAAQTDRDIRAAIAGGFRDEGITAA